MLPHDLLEQVRGRVRLLTALLFAAFAFDPVFFYGIWALSGIFRFDLPGDFFATRSFQWVNVCAVIASAGLWWVAGDRRIAPSRLVTLGLAYEVTMCFVISILTYWQCYLDTKILPNLTWVPAIVIFFPLVLPGPPRRMLAGAIVAGAMPPLTVLLLARMGKIATEGVDSYLPAIVSSTFAVVFAYMGARVIYGLGRAVAEARELGSYRLEERLGEGGMGEVWRARHRMLARPAAIKLIRRSLSEASGAAASGEALRRFEREAQAIASLRSPHTVELFDFGVSDDGTFYYVMELLDGMDTDRLVRRFGPLPADRVIHILRQVCHSLSEAESRDLVHRDIKPANIYLCRYGEEHDFVKVLDFGLVKTVDEPAGEAPPITIETAVRGTPAFIAPEQAVGGKTIDGRADIYATGCVAYWLLTGELVFTADTPMALVIHHARTAPTPPSARSEIDIPDALDRLVLACLAKDPNERPQTARELSRRLAAIDAGGVWTEERARAWWERHLGAPARDAAAPAA